MTCPCTPCTLDRIEDATQLTLAGGRLPTAAADGLLIDSAGTLERQAFSAARDGSYQEGDLKHGGDQ